MASNKKEYSLGFLIGAQLKSSFPAAFKGAEKQLLASQKAVKNCKAAWADFGQRAGKLVLGVTGAAAGVAAAAWKMTDSVAEAGDRAAKSAANLHMETEAFQEMEYAFGQAGVSGDEFISMVTKMNNVLAKASKDDKSAAKLAEFGLSADKLAHMSPEQALERLSDYMVQIEDPAERARLSMELFGNSGAAMEQAMLQGSDAIQKLRDEARTTGYVISEEAAKQAEAYGDAKDRLTKSVEGMRRQLFGPMMSGFTSAFDSVSDQLAAHLPDVQRLGAALGEGLVKAIPKVVEFAGKIGEFGRSVWDAVQKVKDFVGGWKNLGILVAVASQFKTIVSGGKALISTFKMLKTGIGLVTKLFPVLGKAGLAALGPALPIVLAVAAAAFIIYKNWDKLKPMFQRIFGSLKDAWGRIWPKLQEAGARIQPAISKIGDSVGALLVFIMPMVERGIDFIITVVENAVNLIGPFFDVISALVTFFCNLVTGNWSKLGEDFWGIVDAIRNFWQAALEAAGNIAKKWVENVLTFFKPLTDFFGKIGDKISSIFGGKKTLQVETVMTGAGGELAAHAAGGIFRRAHIAQIAEDGDAEAVVPINSNPRSQAIWETAGRMAGFFSDSDGAHDVQGGELLNVGQARENAGKMVGAYQKTTTGKDTDNISISVPVSITGNATQETVDRLREAIDEIVAKVLSLVKQFLVDQKRQKARLKF